MSVSREWTGRHQGRHAGSRSSLGEDVPVLTFSSAFPTPFPAAALPPAKQVLFVVAKPEVYKSAHSDCYIVFGDVRGRDRTRCRRLCVSQAVCTATCCAPYESAHVYPASSHPHSCHSCPHIRQPPQTQLSRPSHRPTSHTQAKIEDPSTHSAFGAQALAAAQAAEARQQAEEARKAKAAVGGAAGSGPAEGDGSTTQVSSSGGGGGVDPNDVFAGVGDKKAGDEEDDLGDVDETGVDSDDINTVVNQTKCSRGKAVRALKESKGDLITAIMALS